MSRAGRDGLSHRRRRDRRRGRGPGPDVIGGAEPLELLEPRDVPLGGPRAMTVRRTLPQRRRSLIGAWCFLDHYGPDDVAATGGMNVAAATRTPGCRRSAGCSPARSSTGTPPGATRSSGPGELNLMTAGPRASATPSSPRRGTDVLHGAQLWVALPGRRPGTAPDFEHYRARAGDRIRLGTAGVPRHAGRQPLPGADAQPAARCRAAPAAGARAAARPRPGVRARRAGGHR